MAIQIIQDFLTTKPRLSQENYLVLIGMLTTYKSILVVTERDETKGKLRFKEISKARFQILYDEQKERLQEILKYPGGRLFDVVKDIDLMTLTPGCRHLVLDGLTHYVEITIRNNKREIGKQVCEKIISEMPQNFRNPFLYKLNKIAFIENPDVFDNDVSKVSANISGTEMGEKLKVALAKKMK